MQEVYIDILAFENFIMDYFILYMTSKILYMGGNNRPSKLMGRIALSSGVGVLYTVLSVLLFRSALSLFVFKIALSGVMVYIAFKPRHVKGMFKAIGCFYGVTLLTGGAALCVLAMAAGGSSESFFRWEQPVNYILIVAAIVMIVGDVVLKAIIQKKHMSKYGVDLYVQFDEAGIWIPALIDSGNELKDPWNGKPVVVAEMEGLSTIIPEPVSQFLQTHSVEDLWEENNLALLGEWAYRVRLIPFSSLGCEEGMLIGFRANLVRVRSHEGDTIQIDNQVVCLCKKTLSNQRYRALLGSDLLGSSYQEQTAVPA